MNSKEVVITLKDGLSPSSACHFIQIANQFQCQLHVEYDSHTVNAKSLLGLLALNVPYNRSIYLVADGVDENEALEALTVFLT